MEYVNFWIVIGASLLGGLTPGPATLAIAGTSMQRTRSLGLALAWGVTTGSMSWAIFAALGFGAILATNQWLVEIIRYAGAGYLLWLSSKSARSATRAKEIEVKDTGVASHVAAWSLGAFIHLTNPKAVIFWGSIIAIGMRPGGNVHSILWIIGTCVAINFTIVTTYALLFSSQTMTGMYLKGRRGFEAVFASFFGAAAVYMLLSGTS
ncbi:LysE family translocator [uncultured Tateyamaria sp.]|uniref:LysE family translocator n=1 Tax=uncultured Tateyamaria sp. TaxID=455651 RepID=UPI002629401C|nr:LysE family translocator [uncultured Tateyamaria sp.]